MADIPFPRGVRDLMPNEALFRNALLRKVEEIFQRFGFLPIDTPSFESLKLLKAKNAIGEDSKLIYEIKDEDLGLRYDHTVSLARYVAMHQDMPMPFKRYYIGKVWRRDEPQRLRYREFGQADVDIIGGREIATDAEVIAAGATALEACGLDYYIEINERELMEGLTEKFGAGSKDFINIVRSLDKIEKIGEQKVVELLRGFGLSDEVTDQLMHLVKLKGENEERLSYVEKLMGDKGATKKLREVIGLLEQYSLRGRVRVNFSLMRGFDYYTGLVFEFKPAIDGEVRSIGGGGRYDKLIGLYGGRDTPAVGISLGIDPITDLLDSSKSAEYSYAKVFVAYVNDNNYPAAIKTANWLRANGVATEVNLAKRNLSKQFAFADSLKMKYAVIIGDAEEKESKVKLRNLISGEEALMGLDEALAAIKR